MADSWLSNLIGDTTSKVSGAIQNVFDFFPEDSTEEDFMRRNKLDAITPGPRDVKEAIEPISPRRVEKVKEPIESDVIGQAARSVGDKESPIKKVKVGDVEIEAADMADIRGALSQEPSLSQPRPEDVRSALGAQKSQERRDMGFWGRLGEFITSPEFRTAMARTSVALEPDNKGIAAVAGLGEQWSQNEAYQNYLTALKNGEEVDKVPGARLLTPQLRQQAAKEIRAERGLGLEERKVGAEEQRAAAYGTQAEAFAKGTMPWKTKVEQQNLDRALEDKLGTMKGKYMNVSQGGAVFDTESGDVVYKNPNTGNMMSMKDVSPSRLEKWSTTLAAEFLPIAKEARYSRATSGMSSKEAEEWRQGQETLDTFRNKDTGEISWSKVLTELPPQASQQFKTQLNQYVDNFMMGVSGPATSLTQGQPQVWRDPATGKAFLITPQGAVHVPNLDLKGNKK